MEVPRGLGRQEGGGVRWPCRCPQDSGSGINGSLEDLPESLSLFCLFRLFSASGDMRTNGDKYLYEIQLSSITSSANPACSGANICQVKPNDQHFSRKVGTSDKTKYYVQGNCSPLMFHVSLPQRKSFKIFVGSPLLLKSQINFRTKALIGLCVLNGLDRVCKT